MKNNAISFFTFLLPLAFLGCCSIIKDNKNYKRSVVIKIKGEYQIFSAPDSIFRLDSSILSINVTDKISNARLINAIICVYKNDTITTAGLTDSIGNFIVQLPLGNYNIKIMYAGNTTMNIKRIRISKHKKITINCKLGTEAMY